MFKCIVCGAVFEQSETVCPVCGVGPENFEIIQQEKEEFISSPAKQQIYLIIGGGPAAVYAAEAIRERDQNSGICILTEEKYLPYNRPILTKKPTAPPETILMHKKEWYDQKNICVLTEKKVTKISPELHEIIVGDNEKYHYDKLIYATGAHCFIPDIQNNGLYGVFAIRGIEDINAIASFPNSDIEDAAIIGGGVLGLEAAWMLKKSGIKNITVLEASERIMPRQLDRESSEELCKIASQKGINIITSAEIEKINGTQAAEGITLKDGKFVPARIIIISCGIRANLSLAKECGLETGKGVKVNSHCQTSNPEIFACGDCAEFDGKNYGLWAQALAMGKTAGACAAGDNVTFEFSNYPLTFSGMDTMLYAIGDCMSNPEEKYTVERPNPHTKIFRNSDGKLCGAVLTGNITGASSIKLEI
ncbi:MAG: FAD-dependent oxidoreductase [Clostridia bacterium]|nr:FAD-dependent oxidoreductase [Clostridia bacterium]